MSGIEPELVSGAKISRAFFAALLAAVEGNDNEAAEILRQIAKEMRSEFIQAGGTKTVKPRRRR